MGKNRFWIDVDEHPTRHDMDAVRAGLRQHNERHLPGQQWRELVIYLRGTQGEIVGGMLGEIGWAWLHISILWVNERLRGSGHGGRLLAAAEAEAQRAGCRGVFLDTFSFQARPFYERNGYEVFGTLADFPPGHDRYFLRKLLDASSVI